MLHKFSPLFKYKSAEEEYMAILGKETVNDVELDEDGNEIVKEPNEEGKENEHGKTPDPAAAIKPATDADNPEKNPEENPEGKEGDEEANNDAPKPPRTVIHLFFNLNL